MKFIMHFPVVKQSCRQRFRASVRLLFFGRCDKQSSVLEGFPINTCKNRIVSTAFSSNIEISSSIDLSMLGSILQFFIIKRKNALPFDGIISFYTEINVG